MEEKKKNSPSYLCGGKYGVFKKQLVEGKKNFSIEHTNATVCIRYNDARYVYTDNHVKSAELKVQRKLKKHILDRIEKGLVAVPEDFEKAVGYFQFSDFVENMELSVKITPIVNYDIEKAYYTFAYNLGYIDEKLYKECIALEKIQRLRLIGSIATKKQIMNYVGGEIVGVDVRENIELRRVWFHICHETDKCLKEFAELEADKFLFYWVDGIYLKGVSVEKTQLFLENKYKIKFKTTPIEYIEKTYINKCYQLSYVNEKGKLKPFSLPAKTRGYEWINKK